MEMIRLMITFFSHSQASLFLLSSLSLSVPHLSSALSHSFLPHPYLCPAAVRVICLLWGEASGCSLLSSGPQGSASWWEDSGCQGPTPQSPETKLQGHSGDGGEDVSVKPLWNKWRSVSVAQSSETQTSDILTLNHWYVLLYANARKKNEIIKKKYRYPNGLRCSKWKF